MGEVCTWSICFVPLADSGEKFFGFSEYLAALALMVLAWTIADVRYRFRLKTAPLPLLGFTFSGIGAVGILALLTDWWRAEQWLVPKGNLITPAGWQAVLGGAFLLTFMMWVWFAFIRPAKFGRWNARRFIEALYRAILRGSPVELPEIADELTRSAESLIQHSWRNCELKTHRAKQKGQKESSQDRLMRVRHYAYDVLLMIADRKFCRHVVQSSPITALALFEEIATQEKFDVPLDTFAKNITSEAIANRDSFAYHEVEGYYTGYVGFHKPLTKALYGNYAMVDALDQVFDVDFRERDRWDADQWETFGRLVLVTFENYIDSGAGNQHSFVLFRAVHEIQGSIRGLYKINGSGADWWTENSMRQLNSAVDFAVEATKILDERRGVVYAKLRRREGDHHRDVYDLVAELMFEIIFEASSIKEPKDLCWAVQHNVVWSRLFESFSPDGPAARIIKHKLRRLIYDEIARMTEFPNFKGARLLGIALNVLGLEDRGANFQKSARPLRKTVLAWTKKHYASLAAESPRVAASCLVDGMSYEAEGPRLIKTGIQILDREPWRQVLKLEPLPATAMPTSTPSPAESEAPDASPAAS